jgi:hypothetical protein
MIPYLARLLDIKTNSANIASDWKGAIVVPIYKEGDRSVVTNCRPISLSLAVCLQMEHVIAGYLRQVWDISKWYMRANMDTDLVTCARTKESQFVRT